eukprot:jgi/Chrzof1/5626/Cz16g09130.t1
MVGYNEFGLGNHVQPARHFPAFVASGCVGGGFRLDQEPSNSGFNRHIQHLQPKAYDLQRSVSPAALMSLTQQSLTMVTDSCTSVKLATGVWDHIQSQHNITDMTSCLGKEGSVDQVDIMQGDPTTSQQLTSTLASAGVAAMLKQHVEDGCTQLPTTFRPSCSKAHSAWSHDGTDFTTGHAQQADCRHTPRSCSPNRATSAAHMNPSCIQGRNKHHVSRLMRPHADSSRWRSMNKALHVPSGWSDEIAALLRRRGKATDRSGWFPYTPVEVLKIERDRQRQQQQELLSSYTPQPGALYPYRSHTVLKVPKVVARATHSSSMSHSSSSQDDTQHHQYEGCLDHPGDCHNDVISVDDVLKLIAEVKQHNKTRDAESAAAGSKHSSSACLHEGSAAAAMESHSDNFPHKQQAINPLCHGGHDDCSEHHHAAGDVHQRDHQQCGPCPQHLQALAQPPQAAKHSQQQQQQQQSHERQALLPQPSAQAAGQQQSPQLEQLKPSQQPRQQLLSEWWRQDPDISRLVIDMLQAETNDPSSSHHTSSTLKLYDTLLHAGQAACTGHQEIQTSAVPSAEQRHAAWVSELCHRPLAHKLQQLQLEAAAALVHSGCDDFMRSG